MTLFLYLDFREFKTDLTVVVMMRYKNSNKKNKNKNKKIS